MTHKTKGIVLRTVKYGETSLVVTIFTELFGIQSYMVNGARSSKKNSSKAIMLQPGNLLDLEVYHNELKNLQRIKECSRAVLYRHLQEDVVKYSMALFMVELLQKTLRQPEPNPDLFYFCEAVLEQLDAADKQIAANIPLFFTIQLPQFFGFKMHGLPQAGALEENTYLDLAEGDFTSSMPSHPHFIAGMPALITAELLKTMQPRELSEIKLNRVIRRELLLKYMDYYALHLPDFGQLKTLQVLHEVL